MSASSAFTASPLVPVRPAKPPAPYVGGKRNLARRLVQLIDETPHDGYGEPFVGMGGIFLRRSRRPRAEFINDWSYDVANLYRVLQVHYQAFMDMLRWQISSRAEFDRLMATDPRTLTDMQRAARFLYLQKVTFGGKVVGRNFGIDRQRGARFDITRLAAELEDVRERLAGVVIERLPWRTFIETYDRPGMLFYLDPPYFGTEGYYGEGLFSRAEFAVMAEVLRGLKGTFILSLNDHAEVRRIFDGFSIEAVGTHYGLCQSGQVKAGEVIIRPG